jgi:3-dehydroquinate synthase
MNPVEKFKKYAARVPYMHFKDIDGSVLKMLQERKEGFWEGITKGVFCPLGHGLVDYPAMLRAMKAANYAGWVTIEQDFDNKTTDDVEAKLMGPAECCKQNLIYLQSLGVTDPRKATMDAMHSAYCGRFDGSEAKHASPAMAAAAQAGSAEEDPSQLPTSTKWSVLSSRVEGLVAELSQVVGKVDAYCVSQSRAEGPAMKAVREKMLATPWKQEWDNKRTMFSYGEEMSTDPLEAMLLKQLVFMAAPNRVLEIGMFVGYGSVAMLEASPTTEVVSLEIDPYLKGWLSSCLADAKLPQIAARHDIVLGPALDSMPKLTGKFDMVFVDANKSEYKSYVENMLKFNLLAPGGVIVCDNILYNGYPYMHSHFDAQPARRKFGDDIRVFNQWVADHPELEQVVLPIRDGVSIIRRRSDVPPSRSGAPVISVKAKGNLAFVDDTWKIMKEGEEAPLCGAVISDSRIDTSKSEYASKIVSTSGPCAWQVESQVKFDYRVVEVPRGSLLDPQCDALVFGHLAYGSPERAAAMARPQRRLVVVDETVYGFYGAKVEAYFKARGVECEIMTLPMSEDNKSMDVTLKVCKKMKDFKIDRRHEPVIAIGGGVCLDVVGLAASMFRRRTPYIRVPTTSLAYVDASVGAKNGCNFCGSKNRLGTYVPPVAALLDADFFKTQKTREVSNSLGEMAKMAIMKSPELFKLLAENGPRLIENRFQEQSPSDDVPARVLRLSIETMLEELAPNLWEDSLDRLVDFGHAVGQCLEMEALGTEYELMHGEAVACDMAYMTVLSTVLGHISTTERDSILHMLRRCSVPVHNPLFDRKFFKDAMKDRIANSMGMRLPLPVGIGKARCFNDVSDEAFERAFVEWEKLCASAESRMPRPPTIQAAPTAVPGVKAYYTFTPAPNAMMVDIFLREKGVGTAAIKAMERYIDLPALDNRSPEILKMNPQGSVPFFVMDDDTVVAETIAMMEYVEEVMPEPVLVGSNFKERGVVRQWQRRMEEHYCWPAYFGHRSWTASDECADDHFMKNFFAQRLNAHHGASLVPKEWKTLCEWAKCRMQWLNRIKQEEAQTKGKTSDFICGDAFTMVDIQVYVTLWFFSEAFPHPPQKILQELDGQIPWVQAWFDRVHSRPACVAAREYREQNMAEKPTAQSNAADVPANVKESPPKEKPIVSKDVVLQEKPQSQESAASAQYRAQLEGNNDGPPLSLPSFDLSGMHYIVTGGSQGLGLEIASQLQKLGASKIAIMARTRSRGETAAAQLTMGSCTAHFVQADMTDPASLQAAGAEAIKILGGRVDGLVNAAGSTERGNMMDTTVEMFDKQFDTNTRAPFLLAQVVAKHMIEQKTRGSIVNISSLAAKGGAPFIMAYSASKAALNVLTQNNATELAPHGIRMNAINMGWTYTENENELMVAKGGPNWLSEADAEMPLKRLMRPVDVACTACFLLSPAAQMMTGNVLDLHPDTNLGMLSTKTTDSLER